MEVTHRTNNLRIAPRKLRLVADQFRHQNAERALELLPLVPNKGALLIQKSLKSAIQVAKDNDLNPGTLVIQRIWCDEGTKLRRVIGHSRGRMSGIHKHYSHLSIVLKGEPAQAKRKRVAKAESQQEAPAEAPSQVAEEEK